MKKRNFAEDLTAVLVGYNFDPQRIKFPIKMNSDLRSRGIGYLDLNKRSVNVLAKIEVKDMQGIIDNFDTIKDIKGAGVAVVKDIKNKFIQWWYERLEEKEMKAFWKEFVRINQVA